MKKDIISTLYIIAGMFFVLLILVFSKLLWLLEISVRGSTINYLEQLPYWIWFLPIILIIGGIVYLFKK